MIVLTPDIPWNHVTLSAPRHLLTLRNLLEVIESHRAGLDYHLRVGQTPHAASWHANRLIETCDDMERRGFFSLAQGREPNPR